jgi:hypothetical protein
MGLSLAPRFTTAQPPEDQSWLGSAHGTQEADSVTLLTSAFTTLFPTGIIPSGILLGKVTASGFFVPALTASSDGSQVALGHLFTTVDLTAGGSQLLTAQAQVPAALMWHGEIILAKIPAVAGVVDLTVAANQPRNIRYV